MVDISRAQYKMLLKFKRHTMIAAESLSDKEKQICKYLYEQKFLTQKTKIVEASPDSFFTGSIVPYEYQITEHGYAQISTYTETFFKWWIPVVISLISLTVSIFAICK